MTRLIRSVTLSTAALLILLIAAAPSMAANGTVTRSFNTTTPPVLGTVIVTITPDAAVAGGLGYRVTETLPAGVTFVSSTADNTNTAALPNADFIMLGGTPFTYTVTMPNATGPLTFTGTFVDGFGTGGGVVGPVPSVVNVGGVPPGGATGTITGTVTNNTSGAPVAGAFVSAGGVSTTTNAAGVFTLTGVPVGTQTLTISGAGFAGFTQIVTVTAGGTIVVNAALVPGGLLPRIWNETDATGARQPVPYEWNVYNFDGFFYDLKDDLGQERFQLLQPNLASSQRTIEKDNLIYSTRADAKKLKVVEEQFANNVTAAREAGLERTNPSQAFANGNYDIVGWQAERYVALNGKIDKLSKLILEHGTSAADKRTLTVGETWDLGDGWTLSAQSIDAKATPRQAWLVLSKDGVKKDDKIISEKKIYTYVERSLAGETDVPLFVTFVDSVFAGATTDMVQLRFTWVISPTVTTIKSADKFGIMEVVTTTTQLILRNTDSTVSLTQDSTADIMGNIKFQVADDANVLRFMPVAQRVLPGKYETRGAVWNEIAKAGTVGGFGNTATWNVLNFAGFFYDLKDNLGKEQLQINQTNLAANQRTVDKDNLVYSTQAQAKKLKVVKEQFANNATGAREAGLERTNQGQAFFNGDYNIIGWQAERYVALNGKIDKLAKLIMEHGTSAADKKTLTVGETWDLGEGWTLTAQSIDAKATPRQAWLALSKDGVKKDDKIISEKKIYTYVERSLAGETDVPLFVTFVDSVFAGATTDMVQLRFTWVVSPSVTTVKSADKFGIMEVVTTTNQLVLRNTDSTLSLTEDSTVDIMGKMKFRVADQPAVLRFYPKVDFEIGGPTTTVSPTTPPVTPIVNRTTIPPTTVAPTTVAPTTAATTKPPVSPTATKKEPGFEMVFAIAGLLAVAYLVLRQRK